MEKLKQIYNKDSNFSRLIIALISTFILCSILKPELFLRGATFLSISRQFPEFGILAIAIALALLTGGIDLSVVSIANLSAIFAAKIMITMAPKGTTPDKIFIAIIIAILVAILTGTICGIVNGLLISKIGIPAILATLGTQQVFLGIAIVVTQGKPQSGLPLVYSMTGNKILFGFLPVTLIVFIICALAVGFVLGKTSFGQKIYMVGTNEKAARFAGLKNAVIITKTYAMGGCLAAVAGLIMLARTNSAKADFGASYILQCVLIAVLGGVSPAGGEGKVRGVVVAVVMLQMLSSTLSMFENISNFYRDIIWGVVLIAVLISNHYIAKNTLRKQSLS